MASLVHNTLDNYIGNICVYIGTEHTKNPFCFLRTQMIPCQLGPKEFDNFLATGLGYLLKVISISLSILELVKVSQNNVKLIKN